MGLIALSLDAKQKAKSTNEAIVSCISSKKTYWGCDVIDKEDTHRRG